MSERWLRRVERVVGTLAILVVVVVVVLWVTGRVHP